MMTYDENVRLMLYINKQVSCRLYLCFVENASGSGGQCCSTGHEFFYEVIDDYR